METTIAKLTTRLEAKSIPFTRNGARFDFGLGMTITVNADGSYVMGGPRNRKTMYLACSLMDVCFGR